MAERPLLARKVETGATAGPGVRPLLTMTMETTMRTVELTAAEHAKHLVGIANEALAGVIVSQLEPPRRLLFNAACTALEQLAESLRTAGDEADARWALANPTEATA